jgi:hypothetical protein
VDNAEIGVPASSTGSSVTVSSKIQLTALQHLQTRFGITDIGGELRLIDLEQLDQFFQGTARSELMFYSRTDGNIKLARALETLPISSDPRTETRQFWVDPNTKVFDSVAFTPNPSAPTTINYWVPPTIKPVPSGDWRVIKLFLRDVICAGDIALFTYLIQFLAHMLQKPSIKPGIIIVLLGGQGTGKGTFFQILYRIWSRTTLVVSDVNQIVGTFNAALERNYVICMDEALFSGDKKSIERLKSLVTEPVIHIEQKYQPARSIESFHRFFATSNNDFFGQVDSDDRRFVFFRVSDRHQTDHLYFDTVHKAIDDDVCMRALVHDLLNLDLHDFNPRQRPTTSEHLSQRLQSLNGFDRYWYEKLCLGQLPKKLHYSWAHGFVATHEIQEGYRDFDPKSQHHRSLQDDQIAAKLRKYCPSARKARSNQYGSKLRGYELPALDIARQEFATHLGGIIDWDVPETPEKASRDQLDQPGRSSMAQ